MKNPNQNVTKEQRDKIRRMADAANKRLMNATAGQRRALEWYNKDYLTTKNKRFSKGAAGMTKKEADKYIKALDRFLKSITASKPGWERIKKESVAKANITLSQMGYHLTDEELALILIQLEEQPQDFYDAVDKVEAAKLNSEEWDASTDKIAAALSEQKDAQEALIGAIQARKNKGVKR